VDRVVLGLTDFFVCSPGVFARLAVFEARIMRPTLIAAILPDHQP
jgi:hypothetical protein